MTTLALVAAPARFLTAPFWRAYAVTMRPYLLFVSGITGIAGIALAPDPAPLRVGLLSLAFFLAYGFGQALTDCFQLDTDSLSAPYRPLVRGTIRRNDVLVVSLLGLAGCGLLIGAYEPATLPLAGLTVMGLATYTWFKRRWWGGPLYNAWIVAVVLLMGYLAAGGTDLASWALAGALATALFGYANFVLVGYYKDVTADRATGYRTLPVVFGLRVSHRVSDAFAALAAAGAGLAVAALLRNASVVQWLVTVPFAAAAVVALVVTQVRTHRVTGDADAHRAVAPVVHAYLLLGATIAVAARPLWAPALALFYWAFVVTLRSRPMPEQI